MNLTNFYHNAPTRDIRLFRKSFSNEQSPNVTKCNLTNFYHNAPTRDIRLFRKSFSNEHLSRMNSHQMVGICAYFDGFIISFWCTIFVSEKLLQNLTNFYHNAPTGDIILFMQSFSNEQSPNEPYEFLPQCSYT
ncbi:hypothetical protein OROHE_020969 [Orobanche hederae]